MAGPLTTALSLRTFTPCDPRGAAATRHAKTTPPMMATKRLGGGVLGEFANAPEVVVELPPAPTCSTTPDRQRSHWHWWSRPRGHHLRSRTKTTQRPPFLANPHGAPIAHPSQRSPKLAPAKPRQAAPSRAKPRQAKPSQATQPKPYDVRFASPSTH